MSTSIIDLYPFLDIKKALDTLQRISVSRNWVAEEHRRRLEAYTVLAAYTANLSNKVRNTEEQSLLEYGDANFVCTTLANALLGDDLKIVAPKENKKIEDFFMRWAKKELLFSKIAANEYTASNLGDCVYKLNYSKTKKRVEVKTFDPGFWFPFELGTENERHIFAWEEADGNGNGVPVIYKEEYYYADASSNRAKPIVQVRAGYYEKGNGSLNDLKRIRWAKNSDGEELNDQEVGDFFPIVYIPNIFRTGFDFGESDLTGIWRILDQLANTYTDEATNARVMGLVQMWMNSETFDRLPANKDGSKKVEISENFIIPGEAGVVDNSMLNEALMKYQTMLEEKLYVNSFISPAGSGSGSTGSQDRTTGIIQFKNAPLQRFIWTKRLLRQQKYDKLLNFVARFERDKSGDSSMKSLFRTNKSQDLTEVASLQFGNTLPIDQDQLMTNIQLVAQYLSADDLKDNIREAGLIVNGAIEKPQAETIAPPKPTTKPSTKGSN